MRKRRIKRNTTSQISPKVRNRNFWVFAKRVRKEFHFWVEAQRRGASKVSFRNVRGKRVIYEKNYLPASSFVAEISDDCILHAVHCGRKKL